ncbi:MAG TPA: hypothetical protein VFC54_14480 [Pseudolabrys sp.]|nr:hypothetical protein [Pseudolabrys sp.]
MRQSVSQSIRSTGFAAPHRRAVAGQSRFVELATIAGLAISTVVAFTAITVGAAHASVADGVIGNEGSLFTISLLLGLIFIGIGGLSILPQGGKRRHRH